MRPGAPLFLLWCLAAAPAVAAPEPSARGAAHGALDDGEELVDRGRAGRPIASRYTLRRCLELAERNFPKVQEARSRLAQKQAQQSQSRSAPYSDFTLTSGVGLAPTVFGTSLYSPNTDVALTSNMGLAWQVGVDGTVPLWTFGKITSTWAAADAQVSVGEHEVKQARNQVKLDVRQAFYGLLLARDALALLREAERRIDKYMAPLARQVEDGDGDEIDLIKLRMHREDLIARHADAERGERTALAGLRFLTGVSGAFDVPDQPLRRSPHSLAPLARYLTAARLFRPEVNMARAGLLARRAQLDIERARLFPDIGLALSGRWAHAPEVADQTNPFVRDNGNFFQYGAAIALRWKLDFLPQSARIAQAEAQLEEMRATERYALGGVGFEVEQAFGDARASQQKLDALTRATRYAKQWLVKVQQGIDVGTFEDKDIVDPAREYAQKRYAQMAAIYEYNLAIAKLALATGWDVVGDT